MFDRPVVDSVTFAREAGELRGKTAITNLVRLCDALADDSGEITYILSGFVSEQGKPSLRLSVSGELKLACQRCLGPLNFRLTAVRNFDLIEQGIPLGDPADEAADVEQIHADPKLDVLTVVEDEALLSLPMVPSHEREACETLAAKYAGTGPEPPFSKLSVLKRQ